jgi:hypothetical protein
MLNRKTVMALAAAMVMAVLYGCSGSDNSGLKNDLEMYKGQVADLTTQRDARITPEAAQALREELGEMELTPQILEMLVARADITADAYEALMDALPGMELTEPTLRDLAGRAAITAAEYEALMDAMGTMDLTPANIAMLLGRANITASLYDALMREMPQGMDLTVLNLRMLAERAGITADDYRDLETALLGMDLSVATLQTLVGRAEITQLQYNALTNILPTLNDGTSLQNVVTMANQYTALLAALGATDMSHADAVALAMALVAEEAIDPADANRIARKIAGLVMADTVVTADDIDLAALLMDRFGEGAIGTADTPPTRQATIIDPESGLPADSGLSVGMLEAPSLQLNEVPAGIDDIISPDGFEGALFNEGLPGGRYLKTYAYTDVMVPQEETFETAYGRLMVVDAPDPDDILPVVEDPKTGSDVTPDQITAYSEYVARQATYDLALANYQRDLAAIAQGDFMGHPVAGGPSNTPAGLMQVVADVDEDGTLVDTVTQFWSLARIETRHLPMPPPRPVGSVIVTPDPMPTEAQYQAEGVVDEDDNMLDASMLSGTFDGVPGNFMCTTTQAGGLCTIGAVRLAKPETEEVGRVVAGVEYSFDPLDTWKFVADDPEELVATPRQDGDYLVMGWWLETASVSTGDFKFGRFFAGSDPYGDTAEVVVPGEDNDSAEYTGSAVGKYAERDAGTDTARKGLFRATATLVATFEGDGEDMIEGTIDEFVDDSGVPRMAWHVVLGESAIAAGAFGAATSGEAEGQDWKGSWNGEFYGRGDVPSSVAGLFNATFGCPEMATGGCDRDGDVNTPLEGAGVGFVGVSGVFGAHHSEMENFAQPVPSGN